MRWHSIFLLHVLAAKIVMADDEDEDWRRVQVTCETSLTVKLDGSVSTLVVMPERAHNQVTDFVEANPSLEGMGCEVADKKCLRQKLVEAAQYQCRSNGQKKLMVNNRWMDGNSATGAEKSKCTGRACLVGVHDAMHAQIDKAHQDGGRLHNRLSFGNHTYIEEGLVLSGRLAVGRFCELGRNLRVMHTADHNMKVPALAMSFYHRFGEYPIPKHPDHRHTVKIGHDVWIGRDVTLLKNALIDTGSVVGAGAVVTGMFPPYSVIAGNPAKLVRYRYKPDVIELLLEIEWWHWSDERIQANRDFFFSDLTAMSPEEIRRTIKPEPRHGGQINPGSN